MVVRYDVVRSLLSSRSDDAYQRGVVSYGVEFGVAVLAGGRVAHPYKKRGSQPLCLSPSTPCEHERHVLSVVELLLILFFHASTARVSFARFLPLRLGFAATFP